MDPLLKIKNECYNDNDNNNNNNNKNNNNNNKNRGFTIYLSKKTTIIFVIF